jgi:hypothetical protein
MESILLLVNTQMPEPELMSVLWQKLAVAGAIIGMLLFIGKGGTQPVFKRKTDEG